MQIKQLALAGALLLGSAGLAAAAPALVTADLNLRSGPGTNYGVVNVLPGGATVDVLDCAGSWCRVAWGGVEGFASRSYLGLGGPAYAASPRVYYGSPVYVGPPAIGFGFGWGGGWRSHGWSHHGGHRSSHRHHR